MAIGGQVIERLEVQSRLLNPASIGVCRNSLAGGHTAERYWRDVGEYAHRQIGEVFVHHLALKIVGKYIADKLNAWQ